MKKIPRFSDDKFFANVSNSNCNTNSFIILRKLAENNPFFRQLKIEGNVKPFTEENQIFVLTTEHFH